MAKEYASKGFKSIFVYTREAHPGEHYPAHRSIEQKISQAMAFKQILDIERPILVDDVVGTGHHMYGTLPNMTYVVARGSGQGAVPCRLDRPAHHQERAGLHP